MVRSLHYIVFFRRQCFLNPCEGRIPNFVGAEAAGQLLANTPEFQRASVVKINPSLAQTHLRELVLMHGRGRLPFMFVLYMTRRMQLLQCILCGCCDAHPCMVTDWKVVP